MMLSPEELLAGSGLTYEAEIPPSVLRPTNGSIASGRATVRLRPLTVSDLQLVTRAARESDSLLGVLMVQRALVEPEMTVLQVSGLHVGLLQFLLGEVNRISAIVVSDGDVAAAASAPLSRAAFLLAKEYGWTPQQVSELTLGQVLLHLEMLSGAGAA
jgi:hypothetical protein